MKWIRHIFSWLVITAFIFATSQTNYEAWKDLKVPSLFIFYIILGMIVPYYFTIIKLVPKFYLSQSYKSFFYKTFAIAICFIFCSHFTIRLYFFIMYGNQFFPSIKSFLQSIYIITVNVLIASSIAGVSRISWNYFIVNRKLIEIEKEKLKIELEILKSNIHPHYLFNIMNSIYFLIDKENHTARNTVERFSNLMRYLLYESNNEKVNCQSEIDNLKDYFEIQKMRYGQNYEFTTDISDIPSLKINPHFILPLLENAFKHLSNHDNKINFIELKIQNNQNEHLEIQIINSYESDKKNENKSKGIGLENIQKRLKLLYNNISYLKIDARSEEDIYKVTLKLPYAD